MAAELESATARNLDYEESQQKCELVANFCNPSDSMIMEAYTFDSGSRTLLQVGSGGSSSTAGSFYTFSVRNGTLTDSQLQSHDLADLARNRQVGISLCRSDIFQPSRFWR